MTRHAIRAIHIKAAAGASQRNCNENGYGHQILLFADGSTMFSLNCNDVVARGDGSGGWEYPVMRITQPMTMVDIRSALDLRGISHD